MDGNKKLKFSEDSNTRKVILLSSTSASQTRTRVYLNESEDELYDPRRKPLLYNQRATRSHDDDTNNRHLQLLLNLTSTDQTVRLDTFRILSNPHSIQKVFPEEVAKQKSPLGIRLEALKKIGGLTVVTDSFDHNPSTLNSLLFKLLELISEDPSHSIRAQALLSLETFIRTNRHHFKMPDFEDGEVYYDSKTKDMSIDYFSIAAEAKDSKLSTNFNILAKLKSYSLNISETIFALLSYVGANDTHRDIRLIAMELLGRVPLLTGTVNPEILFSQSVKKDQIVGMKKKKNSNTTLLPLLCCGVFAHGIEDQFVKIRFSALSSLHSLTAEKQSDAHTSTVINVFLDALLDECDLIRLAALNFIKQLGPMALSINSGLESLLAALDDQNSEIRTEALQIIGTNLILPKTADPKLTLPVTVNEMLLRSQRCLEAALQKYPEMEFEVIEAAFGLMKRLEGSVKKLCPDFWAHLMQSPLPKLMTPSSLLPYTTTCTPLSNVQSAMQIPFLDEKDKMIRLVRIVSRIQGGSNTRKLDFYRNNSASKLEPSRYPVVYGNESVDFFGLIVRDKSLAARYLFDERYHPERLSLYHFDSSSSSSSSSSPPSSSYFSSSRRPAAFFQIISIRTTKTKLFIEDFKLIGSIERVQLCLRLNDMSAVPFELCYGGSKLVADISDGMPVAILNVVTNEVVYKIR